MGIRRSAATLVGFTEWHRVDLEAVVDDAVAVRSRNLGLELLDLGRPELDDPSAADVDEVVVVFRRCGLVTTGPVKELVALQDTQLLEQTQVSVEGRKRDAGVDPRGTAMQLLNIGMVVSVGDHLHDDAALLGDAKSLAPT